MKQKKWYTQKKENDTQNDEQLKKEIAEYKRKERLKKYYGKKYYGKP
jgi:hypothetical protein